MLDQDSKSVQEFDSFDQFFEQAEARPSYWLERAKLEFTRDVYSKMRMRGFSKSELASKLTVSPAMVTRLLNGRNNFEMETMVRIAMALNCRYLSHLQPVEAKTFWCDVFVRQKFDKLPRWNPDAFRKVEEDKPAMENSEYVPIALNP